MCIDLVMFIQKYSVEQKKAIKKNNFLHRAIQSIYIQKRQLKKKKFEPKPRNTEEKRKTRLKRWKIIRQVFVYRFVVPSFPDYSCCTIFSESSIGSLRAARRESHTPNRPEYNRLNCTGLWDAFITGANTQFPSSPCVSVHRKCFSAVRVMLCTGTGL